VYQIPILPPQAHDDLGRSALPDAPVVPDRPRGDRFQGARQALATGLRAAARAVEPAPRRRVPLKSAPGVRA
jgi:hypothetical protein